jgi:hypothetical protein
VRAEVVITACGGMADGNEQEKSRPTKVGKTAQGTRAPRAAQGCEVWPLKMRLRGGSVMVPDSWYEVEEIFLVL